MPKAVVFEKPNKIRKAWNRVDLTGHKYGLLEVLREAQGDGRTKWWCRCKCGRELMTRGNSLRSGNTRSCGCVGGKGVPAEDRFWKKVNKEGPVHTILNSKCWIWLGPLKGDRYGRLKNVKGEYKPHRFSWNLHIGKIPVGLQVLHKCDTPTCVNPKHLFLGTQQDNIEDMRLKGRTTKGRCFNPTGKNGSTKLTEKDILEIRKKYKKGNGLVLAEEYGVNGSTISRIITGARWGKICLKL